MILKAIEITVQQYLYDLAVQLQEHILVQKCIYDGENFHLKLYDEYDISKEMQENLISIFIRGGALKSIDGKIVIVEPLGR